MTSQFQYQGCLQELGQAFNLLKGLDIYPYGVGRLYPSERMPLRQFPVQFEHLKSQWHPLEVSFHSTASSLIERLSPYRVVPLLFDGAEFNIQPGRLLSIDQKTYYRQMSEWLGIELHEEGSYLLFDLKRTDGRADHEVTVKPTRRYFDRNWHLTNDWRKTSAKLRPGKRIHDDDQHDAWITAEMAQHYVDAFYEFGTHFMSAIEWGDRLLQVVTLQPEFSAKIESYWQQVGNGNLIKDTDVMLFGTFLGYPYAREVSRIVSIAGDQHLDVSVAKGEWSDTSCLNASSILARFQPSRDFATHALLEWDKSTPIAVELISLARFLEYFRAINFERVLRGALMQRWGHLVQLPLRRMPSVERAIATSVLPKDTVPVNFGQRILLYGDHLDVYNASLFVPNQQSVIACHRVFSVRGKQSQDISSNLALWAQYFDAEPSSHQAAILRLSEEQFEQPTIVCQTMVGAVILENATTTARDVVVDGIRFTDTDPDTASGYSRVRVRGDLHSINDQALTNVLPCLRAALRCAALSLDIASFDTQKRHSAVSFAGWLADMLPEQSDHIEIRQLRTWSLYLSRIEALEFNEWTTFESEIRQQICQDLSEIASFAIATDEKLRTYNPRLWDKSHLIDSLTNNVTDELGGDILEQIRSFRNNISEKYCTLLEATLTINEAVMQQAVQKHQISTVALAESVAALEPAFKQLKLLPARGIILDVIISAYSQESVCVINANLLNDSQDWLVEIALEFARYEFEVCNRLLQLETCERLFCTIEDLSHNIAQIELGLLAIDKDSLSTRPFPVENADLRKALIAEGQMSTEAVAAIDHLLQVWDVFVSTRSTAYAARSAYCGIRMEMWEAGERFTDCGIATATGITHSVAYQLNQEEYHLLAILGKVLRCQRAMLAATGQNYPKQLHIGQFELGEIGYAIRLQNEQLLVQ
ncbi:hypothetical protein LC612_32280 [Nostoc sp. CHAB 5834]|nr:hypothetical protein [Nostoc sp. CHAB 5834]